VPSDRLITLKIDGEIAKGGRVPLDLLAEKIKAMQELILSAAQVVRPIFPKAKSKKNEPAQAKVTAKDACRLVFVNIRKNCLTLEAELPITEALFPEHVEWGLQSADRAGAVLWAIQQRDERRLADLVPDPARRLNLVRKAENLVPRGGDYTISLTTANQFIELTPQIDAYIDQLEAQLSVERRSDTRTITGEVYLLDSHYGEHGRVGIKVKGHYIVCDLGPDARGQIRDLSPGIIAEITGKADLTKTSKVRKITEAQYLRALGMEPLQWTRIVIGEKDFQLTRPLEVKVHFDNEGWTYEAKEFGIRGYGPLRRDAAHSFQEDFSSYWESIAQAPNETLTLDAQELKAALHSLVRTVGRAE
jgi:hypothetical protein